MPDYATREQLLALSNTVDDLLESLKLALPATANALKTAMRAEEKVATAFDSLAELSEFLQTTNAHMARVLGIAENADAKAEVMVHVLGAVVGAIADRPGAADSVRLALDEAVEQYTRDHKEDPAGASAARQVQSEIRRRLPGRS